VFKSSADDAGYASIIFFGLVFDASENFFGDCDGHTHVTRIVVFLSVYTPFHTLYAEQWRSMQHSSSGFWKKLLLTYSNEIHGWQETVSQAGHSLAMMVEHYRALTTKAEARKFWAMRP
jgi:hypothetical protein